MRLRTNNIEAYPKMAAPADPMCDFRYDGIDIAFIPREGVWRWRETYEIFQLAENVPNLSDMHTGVIACEGGFAFPRPGELIDSQMRLYGTTSCTGTIPWRDLPSQPGFERLTWTFYQNNWSKCIHLRPKLGVPLSKVVDLYRLIVRAGHHVIFYKGFKFQEDDSAVLNGGRRTMLLRMPEIRRICTSLGFIDNTNTYTRYATKVYRTQFM